MVTSRRPSRASVLIVIVSLALMLTPAVASAKRATSSGLSGTVTSASLPVAGAVVTAYALPRAIETCPETDDTWRAAAATTTNARGEYALALAPGHYRLGVVPPAAANASFGYRVNDSGADGSNVTSWVGYADDVLVPAGSSLTGMDVSLSTPRSIAGVVTEDGTGQQLAGVEVRAVSATNSQLQRVAPKATTGPTGSFAITGLPAVVPDPVPGTPENEAARYGMVYADPTGWHQVWVWWFSGLFPSPNDTPVVDLATEPAPVRDAALTLTARYTGVVRDGRGRPLAGIAVEPYSAFPYPPRYTDAKGRYAVEAGLPEGWVLRFSDPAGRYRTTFSGGYEFASQSIAADPTLVQPTTPGTEKVSNVTLLEGSRLTALVAYSAEVPAGGGQGYVWRAGHAWTDPANMSTSASIACDGTVSLTGLWPGTHNIGFGPPRQWGPSVVLTEFVPAGGTLALGRVTMPSWIVIGQVNGPEGPLPGIEVDILSYELPPSGHALTNDNGQFRVFTPYTTYGTLQVRAHDPLERWPDQTMFVDDDDPWDGEGVIAVFQMAPPTTRGIEGYVEDGDGNPVAGVTTHLLFDTYDITGAPSDVDGYYTASITYAGGLPPWVVAYEVGGNIAGYYSDTAPTHLVADIGLATGVNLTDPFTTLEVVTLP